MTLGELNMAIATCIEESIFPILGQKYSKASVTLMIRVPDEPELDIMVTNDTIPAIKMAIDRHEKRPPQQ